MTLGFVEEILRYRSGFRLRTPAPLTPAKRLKFESSRMTFGSLPSIVKVFLPRSGEKFTPKFSSVCVHLHNQRHTFGCGLPRCG